MAKLSKRVKAFKAKVDRTKAYPFDNAVALIKEVATAKFNESIDVCCCGVSLSSSVTLAGAGLCGVFLISGELSPPSSAVPSCKRLKMPFGPEASIFPSLLSTYKS